MSHSPPNYMDGVPVKISERFKPPPKIVLPQGVVNRLHQYDVGQVLHDSCYDGELEDTVLKRITEWKAVKERERYDRKVRLQVREQERMRLLEQEQKQKLNQISYPNTDELSSASDDNDADGDGPTAARTTNGSDDEYEEENDESAPSGSSDERTTNAKPFDHMSQLSSILVPTVIRDTVPSAVSHAPAAYPNVLVKATTTTTTIPKTAQSEMATSPPNATFGSNNNNNNNNYNKINYSDFENDTSSPFDNMELRTINDLDILAQVLKQNATLIASPVNEVEKHSEPQEPKDAKDAVQPVPPSSTAQSAEQRAQQQEQPQQQQTLHNPSPVTTNPYSSTAYTTNQQYSMYPAAYQQPTQTTIASTGVNEYLPSPYSAYQPYSNYGTPYEPTALAASCYSNYPSSTYHVPPVSQNHQSSYAPVVTNYAYGYQQQQQSYVTAPSSSSMATGTGTSTYAPSYGYSNTTTAHKQTAYPSIYTTATGTVDTGADAQMGLRSKSRSVPDIMRQLDDEVQDSATRRTRNNSQTIADRQTGTDQYAGKLQVQSCAAWPKSWPSEEYIFGNATSAE
uniref:UMA domain-containing protein n=1 Tax=Anopheles maculatus TaxID=74869 RepID=A0A182T6J9_9DIPT